MSTESRTLLIASSAPVVLREGVGSSRERWARVLSASQDTAVLETVKGTAIHLLLIDESLPVVGARRTINALTLLEKPVPWVGIVEGIDPLRVIALARAGAHAVWQRDDARFFGAWSDLLDLQSKPQPVEVFLQFMATHKRTGRLVVFGDTPFEGSATFENGVLTQGQFASSADKPVLSEMFDLAPHLRWVETSDAASLGATARHASFRARCLVVEDDGSLRMLVQRRLELAGYQVKTANNGEQGLALAKQEHWDIIVADLNMPRLDGWGLLRALQSDVSAREASVIILSAEDNFRDTLKFARVGAKAYIKKTGQLRELVDSAQLILSPRLRVWHGLAKRERVAVDCRSVGIWWLLRTLAELDCRGTLHLADELGDYELQLAEGQLISARSQRGSLHASGPSALVDLLASKGTGFFRPGPIPAPIDGPWLFQWLDDARAQLESSWKTEAKRRFNENRALYLNEELAALYSHLCSETALAVLQGFRQGENKTAALAQLSDSSEETVTEILVELVQRGVLSETPVATSAVSMIADSRDLTQS
jgi:CheY-like chemotaxis protein